MTNMIKAAANNLTSLSPGATSGAMAVTGPALSYSLARPTHAAEFPPL